LPAKLRAPASSIAEAACAQAPGAGVARADQHVVAGFDETRRQHLADVTGAEDSDLHRTLLCVRGIA